LSIRLCPKRVMIFLMMEGSSFAIGICQINGNGSAVNQERVTRCIDAE
jgi:hypothetical protein